MIGLIDFLVAFFMGASLASIFWVWYFQMPPSKLELVEKNIALQMTAAAALEQLDEDGVEEVSDEVTEKMVDAFGEGSALNVTEDTP